MLTSGGVVFDASVASHAFTLGGLSGSGNLLLEDNATTPNKVALSVGNDNASTTYSGTLSGAGSLVKVGTGTLALTGTNTYGGGTTVSDGLLEIGSINALPAGGSLTIDGAGSVVLSSGLGVSGSSVGAGVSGHLTGAGSPAPVPEPGTWALLAGAGVVGLGAWLRRRRNTR
jgi:autotransporter-associated beta strand protein